MRASSGRTDGNDGVDIGSLEIGARERLARDIDKQRFRAFQKGLGPLRPAALLKIPFDRHDTIAVANAGIRKQARKRFELFVASEHGPRGFEDLLLVELVGGNRGRQGNKCGRMVHLVSPPLPLPEP
jgi:hypothetical protein